METALRAAGLENTITDASVVVDNNKAMNIVMAMMAEEKIILLENVRDVLGALLAVSNDRARESPAVRYKVQRELIGLKLDGKGKMKQYLDQFENLVRQYRMAGGQYEDSKVLSKITVNLGESYLVVILAFGNTLRVWVVVLVVLMLGRCCAVSAALEVRALMTSSPLLPAHLAGLFVLAVAGLVVKVVAALALPDEHFMLNRTKFCVQAN